MLRRIIGIYNADGGLWGEMRYVADKILGRASCPLCDITHGMTGEKAEWRDCRRSLAPPIELIHRDEMSAPVAAVAAPSLPCLVGETDAGEIVILLGPGELEGCRGKVEALRRALERAIAPFATRAADAA